MKNIKYLLVISLALTILYACDMYPDWEEYVEYSSTYPVSGEYIVNDYSVETGEVVRGPYTIYIYNKANNPSGDSIWLDNRTGHGTSDYPFKYKIKASADTVDLKFNCTEQGNITGQNINSKDSAELVTITNSGIIEASPDITNADPDSIYFDIEFKYYNNLDELTTAKFKTAGHRKTGWEEPNNDDPM